MKRMGTATNAYTPETLMNLFAQAFNIEQSESDLWLQGIYQDRRRESYGDYYYDRLKDELSGQLVTIKLPGPIKRVIKHERLYLLRGFLDVDVRKDGAIEPVFVVAELAGPVASEQPEVMAKRATILQRKTSIGRRDLDRVIQKKLRDGQQPRIALICGATSIVLQDVTSALGEPHASYDLIEHRVNLFSPEEIINSFAQFNSDQYDAVAVVRGGGPGVEIFDDAAISAAALDLQPILVTAIGHAQDAPLLQQVADKDFITPTAFGTYLRDMAAPLQEHSASPKMWLMWAVIALLLLLAVVVVWGIALSGWAR